MMILAAIGHRIRRLAAAIDCTLTDRTRVYERGDYLDAATCIPCVVDECPDVFDSITALNSHSYRNHQEPYPFRVSTDPRVTYFRYPGADAAGDFRWFSISRTASAGNGTAEPTSAGPLAVEDDPAGILPPLPAGSPNVPAGVSADPSSVPPAGRSVDFPAFTTAAVFTTAAHILEDFQRGFGDLYLDASHFDLRGFVTELHGRAAEFRPFAFPDN